jgi:hypothetical protein
LRHTLKSFRVEGIYIDARAATAEHTERRKNGPALRDRLKERIERAKQLLGKQLSDARLARHLEACDLANGGHATGATKLEEGALPIAPGQPIAKSRDDVEESWSERRARRAPFPATPRQSHK